MFHLKLFLLLTLISFSLEDSHCLITYEYCYEEKEPKQPKQTKISNCAYEDDEGTYCYSCKDGYALTYDGQSCTNSISKCYELDEQNKCKYCYDDLPFLTIEANVFLFQIVRFWKKTKINARNVTLISIQIQKVNAKGQHVRYIILIMFALIVFRDTILKTINVKKYQFLIA